MARDEQPDTLDDVASRLRQLRAERNRRPTVESIPVVDAEIGPTPERRGRTQRERAERLLGRALGRLGRSE